MNITATRFATKARTWLFVAGLTGLLIAIGGVIGGGKPIFFPADYQAGNSSLIYNLAPAPGSPAAFGFTIAGGLPFVLEAKLRLVPLPKAKAVMVIEFADLLESLAATPVILQHKPSAVEVMDKAILANTRQNAALDRMINGICRGC